MAPKIYTRTGDAGLTGLFGGGRVPKNHARVAAYGDVDELNSTLGLVRATEPVSFADDRIIEIQRDLFSIGGQLATPDPTKVAEALAKAAFDQEKIATLEDDIDQADRQLPPLAAFVLPGGSPKAAALHHARTVCRRAERSVVALAAQSDVPAIIPQYLNRLSDLLFVWARLANKEAGVSDLTW